LSLKTVLGGTIDIENLFGGVGIQNRQSGCYCRVPFLAPIKGGIRQGAWSARRLLYQQQCEKLV
jgi:hypothetical protein